MPLIAIIGAGLIGRYWANLFARSGWSVTIRDPVADTRRQAPQLVADSLHELARHGLVEQPDMAIEVVAEQGIPDIKLSKSVSIKT